MQANHSLEIYEKLGSVWNAIVEPKNLKSWVPEIADVRVTDENFNEDGVKASVIVRSHGMQETASLTYQNVEKPNSIQFLINSDNVFARLNLELFEKDNLTHINFGLDFELEGIAKMFASIPQSRVEAQIKEYSLKLKDFIENSK